MFEKLSFRQKWIIVLLVFALIITFFLTIAISRIGKTKVNIELIPKDSSLYIDGKKFGSGDNYLKTGKHTFEAKKSGFIDDKVVLQVDNESLEIGLIPEPKSKEAIDWLNKNPEIQLNREGIGAKMSSLIGGYIEENTPIINDLPYTDIKGPFTIDYGTEPSRLYGIFLEITDSTPLGREAAVSWIKNQGYDPTNIDIRFDDFENPLLPRDINEGRHE